eukprot:388453-Pelagomonas_calceolata.AAC.5
MLPCEFDAALHTQSCPVYLMLPCVLDAPLRIRCCTAYLMLLFVLKAALCTRCCPVCLMLACVTSALHPEHAAHACRATAIGHGHIKMPSHSGGHCVSTAAETGGTQLKSQERGTPEAACQAEDACWIAGLGGCIYAFGDAYVG